MPDKVLGRKGEAKLEEIEMGDRTGHHMKRGKLNEGDKHFGMRSNLGFRKELLKQDSTKDR